MENLALQAVGTDPELLFTLAMRLYKAKDYQAAHDLASYLRQIDPLNARSYKLLGMTNEAIGKDSWAIGAYQRVMVLNALDDDTLFKMAQCYIRLKEYRWAKRRLEECLAIAPEHEGAKKMLNKVSQLLN